MRAPDASPPPVPPRTPVAEADPARRERRALRWGIGLSIGAHLLLLLVYPFLMDRISPELDPPTPPEREWTEPSLEIVLLREIPDPTPAEEPEEAPAVEPLPEEPPEPAPDPDPDPDVVDPSIVELPPPPAVRAEEEPDEAERRSIAERLQPQPSDPRLWLQLEEYAELTDAERAELLLHGMIRSWNDSMAVAAALRRDALDWTYTDDEGRRWGLSPGRLHLGDYSIPLPFSFEAPQMVGPGSITRDWIYADIERGAWSAEMRETWAERAREIRRRMDEERDRRRSGGGVSD